MTPTPEVQERLRRYLLGQLADNERQEFEKDLLASDEMFEELLMVEDEIIDEYLAGTLAHGDRAPFENHFLATPERNSKLKFGRAFKRYLSSGPVTVSGQQTETSSFLWTGTRTIFSSPLRIAVFGIIAVGIVFGIWRIYFHQSDVDKGLLALNAAYRDQRSIESRVTGMDYAPYVTTRGPGEEKIDQNELRRAELTLLDALNKDPTPAVHHALGKVYLAKKEFDKAIEQFDEALKSDPKNAQLYSDLGAALLEKGKLDRDGKDPGKGMEELGRSLENLNKALDINPHLLEALFNRALNYQYLLATREAQASWREYLQKDATSPWGDEAKRHLKSLEEKDQKDSRSAGDSVGAFLLARVGGNDDVAWKVLSESYTSAGNQITNRLIESVVAPHNGEQLADALPALSYIAKLEFDRSGDHYTSDLFRQYRQANAGQKQILASARRQMNRAYGLFTQSKFKDAIVAYSEAQREFDQTNDSPEKAFVDYRLAHCYLLLPDLAKARVSFEQLSKTCRANNYVWLLAQCFFGLSYASSESSEYSVAIDYSAHALTGFEQSGDINGELKCLTQLADLNQALDRMDRSMGYLVKGLTVASVGRTEAAQRWGMLVQAGFTMSSKQLPVAALTYQKEALQIALDLGRPLLISRSYGYVGTAYAAAKMYAEAVSAAVNALQTGANMSSGSDALEITANASQQLGDIHRQAGQCDQAIAAYDQSIDIYSKLNVDYYSYAAHKGKLGCYIAALNDSAARKELETVLDLSEKYRSKITVESERLSFFAMEQDTYDLAIYYELARAKDPIKAFEYSETSRARSLLDEVKQGAQVLNKTYGPDLRTQEVTRPMSPSEIQLNMPADAQILQYAILDDRLAMWVVSRSAIQYQEVGISAAELTEKVKSYLDAVNRPLAREISEQRLAAEDLYAILIAPAEPLLNKSKFLCVVPDKILHYVPYQALVSPTNGTYLIEHYDLGLAPSSSIFLYLTRTAQQKAGKFDERLLAVGNPNFNHADFDSLVSLRSAEKEAEHVSQLSGKSKLLLRDDATETSVRSELEKSDVAHLAAHYLVNDRLEMLSGFPLSPERTSAKLDKSSNGFLQSYEIYGLTLPRTRLVVLSACSTGIEHQYKGEGALSAARPFLVAGVPIVVASLWPVDSEASAELMASFHKYRIRDSMSVTQALRRAQIELARGSDPRYQQPYYWAPFVSIGAHPSY